MRSGSRCSETRRVAEQLVNVPEQGLGLKATVLGQTGDLRDLPLREPLPDEPGHILAAHTRHTPERSSQVVLDNRTRAQHSRDAWRLAALAAAGNQPVFAEVQALAAVLGWAASSEERRNELRARFLAAVAAWCQMTGHDPAQITTGDLLAAPA
jgi:hypothetical protein